MLKNCALKPSVNTQKWTKAAAVRAVKTMAQTAVAVIGTGAVVSEVNWPYYEKNVTDIKKVFKNLSADKKDYRLTVAGIVGKMSWKTG